MLKLLLCVLSLSTVAALVLQLRQQRQELGYQNSRLHDQIKAQQGKLWIRQTVSNHDLKMVPQQPLPRGRTYWIDVANNPDAE